jgi:amino acid transporter
LSSSQVPVAGAAAALFGAPVFSDVMILCGIAGIITSWNGFIVGVSRVLFAMGRARMLPRIFATAHPKSRAPVFALAFMGLASCSAPFFGAAALGWLVNTSAFCTLVVYLLVSVSYLIMRRREPDLPRAYRLKHGVFLGVAVACVSVALLALHLPISPVKQMGMPEIVLIVLWGLIGLVLFVVGRHWAKKANFSELDRERGMFGAYSRQL